LIVVASASASTADEVATRLRLAGNVVYVTHSAEGCLRVATSIAPDVVLLDPALPARLVRILKAHPATAHAQILHLDVAHPAPLRVPRPLTSPPAKAGPHAA
jgi:DNA-binding response OmpR family regulator